MRTWIAMFSQMIDYMVLFYSEDREWEDDFFTLKDFQMDQGNTKSLGNSE